jgi:hypothetical protein
MQAASRSAGPGRSSPVAADPSKATVLVREQIVAALLIAFSDS